MLQGMEDEVATVHASAEQRVYEARNSETRLARAVQTAVHRAEVASASESRHRVDALAALAEIPALDAQVEQLSAALRVARDAEAEATGQLAQTRLDMVRAAGKQSADEASRAERDALMAGSVKR